MHITDNKRCVTENSKNRHEQFYKVLYFAVSRQFLFDVVCMEGLDTKRKEKVNRFQNTGLDDTWAMDR